MLRGEVNETGRKKDDIKQKKKNEGRNWPLDAPQ